MNATRSDALVFFGATGDLAYRKIFPALHAMARRGRLDFPVIGVARESWSLEQLRARARDSVDKHGDADEAERGHLLGRPVLEDDHLVAPEVGDRAPLLVGDDEVEEHLRAAQFDGRVGLLGRRARRREAESEGGDERRAGVQFRVHARSPLEMVSNCTVCEVIE